MTCELCNCDDHINKPCPTCKNCIGHYVQTADYNKVHNNIAKTPVKKPHYRYNGRSGKITEIVKDKSDIDSNFILDTFGG